jgi:prepilin-type processing-associated H-X9-DG protein
LDSDRPYSVSATKQAALCLCGDSIPRSRARWYRRRGVTIIELLAVFGILLLLVSMLVPGLQKAKEQARRVQCTFNLKQWGFALQSYRDEQSDYIPMEGSTHKPKDPALEWYQLPGTWFNVLPPYLDIPPYGEIEGVNVNIRDFRNGHTWICPSKEMTDSHKSGTGKNQFHYAMNQVLDGMGKAPEGSADTPGFPDPEEARPVLARRFSRRPNTVILLEIAPNLPGGSPRTVATEHFRDFRGNRLAKFHGNYANLLLLDGRVEDITANDLFTPLDYLDGAINWHHPVIYWGYPPPEWSQPK